ncbi:MAG TPA: substrate-binding domain-containing protein [Conexibacter sp.]|nr:substrate-binding domain-containing protein [Conexibacter sp.]
MSPRSAIAVLAGVAALAVAGCGSSDSGGSGGSAGSGGSTATFTPIRVASIKGDLPPASRKLWHYDTKTGKYVVVSGDASTFDAKLAKPAKPFTLAYMDPWAANPFSIPIREGVQKYAKQLGLKLIYCDTAFKADKAIDCADLLARQHPAFAIAGNWQSGAADAVMRIFDNAKIPTDSIDVWQPNSVFFGADNYTSGVIGGKAAGEYAKQHWDCKDVWVFLGENKEEGEAADQRIVGFADGVQEVCGKLPSGQISRERMAAATGDQALTVTTDWLTAHPQAKHVLGASLDDERASGIAKAFTSTGRDGQAVGMTCDTVGIEVAKQAPSSQNHYLGCVAFFPEHYAQYLVAIALDVVADKNVPEEVHLEHKLLTHDTIGTYYP